MNAGLGVMLHALSGGTEESASKYYGRRIIAASVNDERARLEFEDGITIDITDEGQSCCEHRYITCDDNPDHIVSGVLQKIEVTPVPSETGEWDNEHERAFVEIATDSGHIKFCTHNEHNGYYGGFALNIREVSPTETTNSSILNH